MKTVLGIILLHLWLFWWFFVAYHVFFGDMSKRNFEWFEKTWGAMAFWDQDSYVAFEKVTAIAGVVLAIVVYIFGLRDFLK